MTARLLTTPLHLRHAPALQRLAADAEVAATTRIPHPYPADGAATFVAMMQTAAATGTAHAFAIERDGELVGMCGLHGIDADVARDLGYWVGRPFWGQGIASFAVGEVLRFGFATLHLQRILAAALQTNTASRRVLDKHGFRCLGVAPHRDPLLKRPHELLASYELTAAAWQLAQT